MTKPLEMLEECSDIASLRPLLREVCMGYGTVVCLDILMASQIGKRQALCFLRMATAEQEDQLMRELGAGRFGGDIVVIVDLRGSAPRERGVLPAGFSVKPEPRAFQPTLPIATFKASRRAPASLHI